MMTQILSSFPASSAVELANELRQATCVLLLTHENPDGDGIGSILALHAALQSLNIQVHCLLTEPCPAKYQFLPGSEALTTTLPENAYDCAMALDCDGESRMAALLPYYQAAPLKLNVDHHAAECSFGDVNWCNGKSAATGLMVWQIIMALDVEITPEIASCLYVSVATDTGFFRFQNTSPEALAMAGQMVAAGADPSYLAQYCCDRIPLARARLLGRALTGLKELSDGDILYSQLSLEDFALAKALPEYTDGIIDELKRIAKAQVICLVREQSPNVWRVSLRSNGLDVAEICRQFGGGGHRLAAGCELYDSADDVEQTLTSAILKAQQGVL